MAPSSRSSRPAASPPRRALGAVAVALAVAASGCGDEASERPAETGFRTALATLGSGVTATGSGFGWIDAAAVEEDAGAEGVLELAGALGPGAGSLIGSSAEIERRTGTDPLEADRLLSISGSYALALRMDGLPPGRLPDLIEEAGGTELTVKGETAYDLGNFSQRQIAGPLSPLEAYASRTAFPDDAIVLARVESARAAMIDDEANPLDEPRLDLAASCLGDVAAARTLPGGLTYNKAASPELLAIGASLPSASPRRQVICAVGSSAADANERAAALERTLGSGGRDPVTGQPLAPDVDSAEIDTLEGNGAYAARAVLTLTPRAPDSFIFAAFDRGSVLTYLGAPAPIP